MKFWLRWMLWSLFDECDFMKNFFLVILVFVGVFLCGGVVGGVVLICYYEQFVCNKGVDCFFDWEMCDFGEKLVLILQQWKEIYIIFWWVMVD